MALSDFYYCKVDNCLYCSPCYIKSIASLLPSYLSHVELGTKIVITIAKQLAFGIGLMVANKQTKRIFLCSITQNKKKKNERAHQF